MAEKRNGVGNNLSSLVSSLSTPDRGLKMCSWNAGALCHHDPNIMKKQVKELERIMINADITLVQEAHGSIEVLRATLHHHRLAFVIHVSFAEDYRAAGLITIFKKRAFRKGQFSCRALEKGRALVSSWQEEKSRFHCINVHNHELSYVTMHKLEAFLQRTKKNVLNRPWEVGLVMAG